MADNASPTAPVAPPARSNLWKWYFLIVLGLSLLATAALWWFNRNIQLTAEELAAQHRLWESRRPADYSFTYYRVEDDRNEGKLYKVDVLAGKVVKAEEFEVNIRDRREIDPPKQGRTLSAEAAQEHSMDALHREAAALLAEDANSERRVYVRARFHPDHGAILELVHRLMRSRRRIQISVLSFRSGEDL